MMGGEDSSLGPQTAALKLDEFVTTNIKRPYGDVVKPPYPGAWRRSTSVAGSLTRRDPSAQVQHPGAGCGTYGTCLWDRGATSLCGCRSDNRRSLILRVGFEDRMEIWQAGTMVAAALHRPEPDFWRTDDVRPRCRPGLAHRSGAFAGPLAALERLGRLREVPRGRRITGEGLKFEPFADLDPTPEHFREDWPPEEPIPTEDYRDPAMLV